MINILVVDDDLSIRQAFKKLIDWERHNFCIKATACNGLDALAVIEKEQIDIVITDIKMPIMSGLELIERVKGENNDIKFIILSGFDEFYLVNDAYKLGVCDYFLKMELRPETILKSLLKLSASIMEEREKAKKEAIRTKLIDDAERYSFKKTKQEKLLREYVYSSHTPSLYRKMQEEGININHENSSLIVLRFSNYYAIEKNVYGGARELFSYGISNVFEEILSDVPNSYFFFGLPDECIVITDNSVHEDGIYWDVYRLFAAIKENVHSVFSLIVNGGFCTIKSENNNIKKIYDCALTACEYCFVGGKGRLIDYNNVPLETKYTVDVGARKFLLKTMLKDNGDDINTKLSQLLVDSKTIAASDITDVRTLFNIYYYEFMDYMRENKCNASVEELLENYKNNLMKNSSLDELNEWLKNIINAIFEKDSYANSTISKAKRYIDDNYYEQIKLSDLAKQLEVSESHMSRLFKSKINMSFTQYLTSVRIENAKRLMKTTNLKVYEISEKVGYVNVEHFSRLFKQITGKSPKEYMEG